MGTRSLLVVAVAAVAAVTLLRREAPAAARSVRIPAAIGEGTDAPARPAPGWRVLDDATGAPVEGARVACGGLLLATDGAGRFEPPDGDDAFVVRADGYPAAVFDRSERDLRLRRGAWRALAIVDEDGNPGARAVVEVYGGYGLLLATAEADARGIVALRLSGDEWLLVRLAGYARQDVHGDGRVVLTREYTIRGRVVDTAEGPVANARVHLRQGDG